ncbi:MAG: CDP-diacylglycerol--glycerol-3-phosphate 3-phosphatidyltransferase [Bacilli bacterium]
MNLPTKLSISRIIMTFLIIFLLLFPFYNINIVLPTYILWGVKIELVYIIAGVLFIAASITDFLDGYIARKNNMITNTGKMLDSIADKVLVNSSLILLAANKDILAIIPIVIVLRDILVNAIKMEAASKGKVVAAIKSGKLKTAALMVGISLKFFYNLPFELLNLQVADFLLYLATILSITSMVEYYNLNKKLIFSKVEL